MKISLIGAGDVKFHFEEILGLNEEEIKLHIKNIAQTLVNLDAELVVLPDKGIGFEVCKKYKELGGKKVIVTVPKDDKEYGIKHLQKYLSEEINGKKVVDEIVNSGHWYKENMSHNLFADKVLLLGYSLGSIGELSFGYYLFKLFKGHKPEVKVELKKINNDFSAGENNSFDTIVYSPFVKDKLPQEIEKYVEKFGAKVYYVKNTLELKQTLSSLK